MYTEIAGRTWQQAALTQYFETHEDNTFFVEACPGAGKTRFAAAAICGLFDKDIIDTVIVIAPQTMLAMQWVDELRPHLPGKAIEAVCSDVSALDSRQFVARTRNDQHIDVLVLTYAGLASPMIADVIDAMARRKRIAGVFDEIHHAGLGTPWGSAVETAFRHATRRILLSGTPFRGNPIRDSEGAIMRFSDSAKIPFAKYTSEDMPAGSERINTDVQYRFNQAIDDNYCRNIVFTRMDGLIEWEETEEGTTIPMSLRMTDEADDSTRARRLAMALSETSTMSEDCVTYAIDKLYEIRKDQEDAAMLVVADSIAHAARIQAFIQSQYGILAPMVTSDDPSSREVIRTFKGDTVPVIVSVQMFSEGVDAPRIRVISYLSRKTAPLFFLQVIGRAVRMQTGDQYPDPFRQWAHMIMPADPELDLMARQVEEQIGHIVGPTVDVPPRIPACPECGLEHCKPRVGSPCPACGYEPEPIETGGSLRTCISGFGEREGLISMGAMADELTLSTVEDKLRNDINLRMRFTAEQLTFAAMFLARNPDIVV